MSDLASPAITTATRARKRLSDRQERLLLGTLGILAVLVPWELLARLDLVNPLLISSPSAVAEALVEGLASGALWSHLRVTLQEWLLGFGLAVIVGVTIGLLAGWFRTVRYIADPFLNVLYAVPDLALVPIFILWFGIGLEFKVWIAFLSAVFVIAVNAIAGVHSTEERYLAVAKTYGANRRKVFGSIVLPGSVPYLMTGLKQGAGRAIVGVIAAEFIASNQGLGFYVSLAGTTLNTARVMAGIVMMAAFGVAVGETFRRVEARFEVWRPKAQG